MKPHPRIRKTIKWGGAAVTVLLVVVWIGSGWAVVLRDDGLTTYGVAFGRIIWQQWDTSHLSSPWKDWHTAQGGTWPLPTQWTLRRNEWSGLMWAFECDLSNPIARQVSIPLWCPTLAAGFVTACACCLDAIARRRARLNLCPKCNYDRAGIAGDAKCPECGANGAVPKGG